MNNFSVEMDIKILFDHVQIRDVYVSWWYNIFYFSVPEKERNSFIP
jgi:hypothetical protein